MLRVLFAAAAVSSALLAMQIAPVVKNFFSREVLPSDQRGTEQVVAPRFGAYREGLEAPIPEWLQQASQEGGPLAFKGNIDVPELFDLGEATQFDDFVEVFESPNAWLAVRKNGEVWGKTWDYEGTVTTIGPIQARSISRGPQCFIVDEAGVVHIPYGGRDLQVSPYRWENDAVTAANLDRATGFMIGGKPLIVALDRQGNVLGSLGNSAGEFVLPPSEFFLNSTHAAAIGSCFFALDSDRRLRIRDGNTGTSVSLQEDFGDVIEVIGGRNEAVIMKMDG